MWETQTESERYAGKSEESERMIAGGVRYGIMGNGGELWRPGERS